MARKVAAVLIGILVALALASWAFGATGNAEAGKAVYDKKCASCHAKDGAGNPGIAKAMKVELRHLGSKEVQAQKDEELKKFVTEGTAKKKPVKGLSDQELADVIAYVRTLKK
ncbi:MAG TPA: cytochrome c [Candidatus Xenobia bacterium]|nr:cytochrome c [Candidatus Xenobia bacterium]